MKNKLLTLVAMVSVGANLAFAEAVKIAADGTVSGDIETKTFMGMASVVVGILGVIYGVRRGVALLKG